MCGIAGVVLARGARVDDGVLRAMAGTLVHRGPDGAGVARPEPHVGLAHRRLAIIDLAGGAQPMSAAGGKLWITFNGEIFNYRELRAELAARGQSFRTDSDTEVLLRVYEHHGTAGFAKLRGQYAFAIWDGRPMSGNTGPGNTGPGRLIAARDPIGIKPFYYSWHDGVLAFASEPRAILVLPGLDRAIDPFGVHLYLRYRFIPAPATAWRHLRKLRPGEVVVLEGGQLTTTRTWQLDPAAVETAGDLDVARRELRAALERAIERERIADVPVGAFLSGGLDSSTIAALLARHSKERIATFTIGFEEAAYDERGFAALVARHIGSHHKAELMPRARAAEVIPRILAHLDEPFGDPSIVPTWLLCEVAARHGKVALSGDGGDELFGGYGRTYRALGILEWPRLLRPFQRALRHLRRERQDPSRWHGDDPRVDQEYVRLLVDVGERDASALYGPRLREAARGGDDPIRASVARCAALPPFSRILAADLDAHLADYHLVKVDRAAMAHGLEVRVPFLDRDLVELAFRWSAEVRLHGGESKGLLRDVVADLLPREILKRDKRGFGPPLREWFRDTLGTTARRDLIDGIAVADGWLSRRAVDALTAPGARKVAGSRIWRLLVLEHWLRRQRDLTAGTVAAAARA